MSSVRSIGVSVRLVSNNYTMLTTDYYVGAVDAPITITLPLGILGKFHIVKNQAESGVITVTGFAGQKIDNVLSKNLGPESSLMVIFDGEKWNVIQ